MSFAEASEEAFSVVCESLTEIEASEAFTAVFLSELSDDERSRPAIPLTAAAVQTGRMTEEERQRERRRRRRAVQRKRERQRRLILGIMAIGFFIFADCILHIRVAAV